MYEQSVNFILLKGCTGVTGRSGLSSHAYLHMHAGSLHNAATMLLLKIEGDAVLSAYNEHVES